MWYLLGYSFMPRLRDLADQHLYKMGRQADHGCLNPLSYERRRYRFDSRAMGFPGAGGGFAEEPDGTGDLEARLNVFALWSSEPL